MIVRCNALYNKITDKYIDLDPSNDLIVGFHYNVLEIMFDEAGISYRINSDSGGLMSYSFIVLARDFAIISNTIPENWILNAEHSCLSPQTWKDMSLWEESFWQDYDENRPKAVACYREEIKTIVAADKEYIPVMIEERLDRHKFIYWQDTMLPLFEEVLDGR